MRLPFPGGVRVTALVFGGDFGKVRRVRRAGQHGSGLVPNVRWCVGIAAEEAFSD